MSPMEIYFIVMVAVGATIGIAYAAYAYRLKQLRLEDEQRRELKRAEYAAKWERSRERERQRLEEEARQKLRQHSNYGHPRFDPKNPDVLIPDKRQIARQYATSSYSNNSTPVVDGSGDLLTAMMLNQVMSGSNDSVAATVQWTDDTPTVREVPVETYRAPERESSYTSTYSSSSSDDSSSRSSYSSSYSSSSSDSSYSSSSSDSSYSSSSSGSSSSWD